MIYYPVLIPTLNRVEHLKRCIESLAKNTGAENTEVYISVDFPPHEKYQKGYEQLKEYLSSADLSIFKKVHIFFQETNLGPSGNSAFLRTQIEQKYDAFIFSEDDNEFSPNFIEYVNKGLEKFNDNEKVIAICASRDTNWQTNGKNFTFSKLYAAYGVGIWINKRNNETSLGKSIILPSKPHSLKKMYKFYKENTFLFCVYILSILSTNAGFFWGKDNALRWCDTVHSIYMHLTDSVCVVPEISKARTWGNDGSGVNMPKKDINPEKEIPLDENLTFDYDTVDTIEFIKSNYKIGNEYLPHRKIDILKAIIYYIIILLFGKNREGAVAFLDFYRNMKGKNKCD